MIALLGLTVFVGAALLFLVQPLLARLLLPAFGGTPAVWAAAALFFQAALLAGYGLAHLVARLVEPRRALILQGGVVLLPLVALPLAVDPGPGSAVGFEPALRIVGVLAVAVGLPFLALATTGPTLQRWLASTDAPAAADPYPLFAAGNLGSLVALVAYPLVVEPAVPLSVQGVAWSAGYVVLAGLTALTALVVARRLRPDARGHAVEPIPVTGNQRPAPPPTLAQRLGWVAFAFVPSSLVLGVTSFLSTDIAPVPLLWVVPLTLYLGSFVLAFGPSGPHGLGAAGRLLPIGALGVALTAVDVIVRPAWLVFGIHLCTFALAAVALHGRLAVARPAPHRLTEFYLLVGVGGVLGGLVNGLAAPVVFEAVLEYPVALVLALLLRPLPSAAQRAGIARTPPMFGLARVPWPAWYVLAAIGVVLGLRAVGASPSPGAVLLGLGLGVVLRLAGRRRPFAGAIGGLLLLGLILEPAAIHADRTFFGVYRVVRDGADRNVLFHGTTVHGIQDVDRATRTEPRSYFHRDGPIGQVLAARAATSPRLHVAVVGLGAGTLAAYGRVGDAYTFVEIDPAVVRIARDPRLFTYLGDSAAAVQVHLGDGRLVLAGERGTYDLIVLDAFSSDAVPVHLLTTEAIRVYLDRLGPGGILAFHVSNRYVELEPVMAAAAEALGLAGLAREDLPPAALGGVADSSHWVLLGRDEADLAALADDRRWRRLVAGGRVPAWTDDHADVVGAIDWTR